MTAVKNAQYWLADVPPRQLIVTIFGLYARDDPHWLPVAGVVRLMADLGVDGQAVRSSISRLKRRDALRSLTVAGSAGYALSTAMLRSMADGDRRIFEQRRPALADGWVQVVFTVPEAERGKRHELRTSLSRLGFGPVAPGVWLAPGALVDEVREVLARQRLAGYVDLFHSSYLGYADLPDRVRDWWDLAGLADRYAAFVERYRTVNASGLAGGAAFAEYVRMLTGWRRLRYLDPGLPAEVLPARWPGAPAGELFTGLSEVLRPAAQRHARSVIR